MQLASFIYILDTIEELPNFNLELLPPHLRAFVSWLEEQADALSRHGAPFVDREALERIRKSRHLRNKLLDEVEKLNSRGELLVLVGEHLKSILHREIDSLELMFGNADLMGRTYDEGLPGDVAFGIRKYLDCLTHNQSGIKVLEVGGGTGSATKVIQEALGVSGGRDEHVVVYDFTDISATFFENA